ncbi:Site-specific recombinase, phage integrase family [Nitrosotalea sinensis]|uniref:Site-specific recombinase, phage integrase family n=1 Tax=Nitrosotalea sinensis TaxID=1499975 RepID=A0A2H1EGM5_9ARCH|nr:site-specific integrase [Candidatus Nitrosotalea sinensis]SHO44254.1 Site-specific recombinase, phage integrase family [Candidatus Nitrosotalea sinensis]
MEKSLVVFEKFVRSEATKKMYFYYFNTFLKWAQNSVEKLLTADGFLQLKDEKLQEIVEDYMMYLRRRLSPNSMPAIIAALELFFSMNDKNLNFKKIRRMVPASIKKSGHTAWTTNDIRKMLQNAVSGRDRAFIHLLSSTGCRIGALQELKLKHLTNMSDNCKSVLFYEGSEEEYLGFLTPEASKAVDEYIDERRKDGERIDQDSPVLRSSYQVGMQKVKSMSTASAKMIAIRLAKSVARNKQGKRYSVMAAHGFRKRFNTILKNNKEGNISLKEKLMGHKGVFVLDGVYHDADAQTLFNEFKIHIVNLTIDESEALRMENLKLAAEKSELVKTNEKLSDALRKVDELWADKQRMENSKLSGS